VGQSSKRKQVTGKGKERPEIKVKSKKSARTIWLEILFFIGLTMCGFSVVTTLLGQGPVTVLQLPSIIPPIFREVPANPLPTLYEAVSMRPVPEPSLSSIFKPSVQYWKTNILQWSADYSVDPNLVATVMQIESCGNPDAGSGAGAMGLFQVMPFHFTQGEKPYDPDTNAKRGIDYLTNGLELSDGHAGLALAGYNGGHSLINKPYSRWPYETQRYYRWGTGIYREASAGWDSSPTLAAWLSAGGSSLCVSAERVLGIQ
jgi:hypothetical protein